MIMQEYGKDEICIVGIGCVLPGASNVNEFWQNLLESKCSIKEIPEERWKKHLYYSSNRNEEDKTYSCKAGIVQTEALEKIRKNLRLGPKHNKTQIMTLETVRQALKDIDKDYLKSRHVPIILGGMEVDDITSMPNFFEGQRESLKAYIKKHCPKHKDAIINKIEKYYGKFKHTNHLPKSFRKFVISSIYNTFVISLIKKKYGITGESLIVDAVCASSLAAVDVAMKKLASHQADIAITGGMHSNLSPETFVSFSKTGALATNGTYPFDKRTDGLIQGEGSVIFVLQRLEDAIKQGNHIYAIIKSCGASSDGKSSSLFQPSIEGQIKALRKAYETLGEKRLDYLECHGTGTRVGDMTELKSITSFFDKEEFPIGSVKALIGHVKNTAGAASMLKCVLSMQNRVIPPSKYFKSLIIDDKIPFYVNTDPIILEKRNLPLRFGVSAFGFGGINYHVVLEEFKQGCKLVDGKKPEREQVAIIGHSGDIPLNDIDVHLIKSKFKILPKSLSQIDAVQLQSLLAVSEAFENANIEINTVNKENIIVISTSTSMLEHAGEVSARVRHIELIDALKNFDKNTIKAVLKHKNKFQKINEDTGLSVLNNVIAGRICNTFNFTGKNYNVDADFNSFPAALNIAVQELQSNKGGILVLVSSNDCYDPIWYLVRKSVFCVILSALSTAKKENYPIEAVVSEVKYQEEKLI